MESTHLFAVPAQIIRVSPRFLERIFVYGRMVSVMSCAIVSIANNQRSPCSTVAAGDPEPGDSAVRGDESRRFLQNKQFLRAAAMQFGRCGQCGGTAAHHCPHLRFAVSRSPGSKMQCFTGGVFFCDFDLTCRIAFCHKRESLST
jgi:hypothetical protein